MFFIIPLNDALKDISFVSNLDGILSSRRLISACGRGPLAISDIHFRYQLSVFCFCFVFFLCVCFCLFVFCLFVCLFFFILFFVFVFFLFGSSQENIILESYTLKRSNNGTPTPYYIKCSLFVLNTMSLMCY